MSDSRDNRFEIDLEEIERQLRRSVEAASVPAPVAPPPAGAPASRPSITLPAQSANDPLAELARIVGQDDPFKGILGEARKPEPVRLAAEARDDAPALTAEDREILGADGNGADQPVLSASRGGQAFDPVRAAYGSLDNAVDDRDYIPLAPRRSRVRLVGVLLALVLAVGAAAGTLLWRRGGANLASNGAPPLIKADNAPLKVAPENPGGVDIPNQNRQIYDRTTPEGRARVVDRQEQPIDVREAARSMPEPPSPVPSTPAPTLGRNAGAIASVPPSLVAPGASPPDTRPTVAARPSSAVVSALGEPRRVRTVTVRPDGSVAPTGPMAAVPLMPIAIPTDSLPKPVSVPTISIPVGTSQATPAQSAATASPGGATPPSSTPPVTVLPPERPRLASAAPVPVAAAEPAAPPIAPEAPPPAPEIALPPGQAPVTVRPPSRPAGLGERVASAATNPAAATSAPVAIPAGQNFVVQIATRNTEGEAQTAYTQLADKYGTDLGGKPAVIAQSEVRGKPVFRVRVGPLSRADANTLCIRLKSAGGACLVTAE